MSRWGDAGPPQEAYSRVTDPGRFASLHEIGRQAVADLITGFDVRWYRFTTADRHEAVLITPADPAAAPLTVEFTAFPGLVLRFGLTEAYLPVCGCDACDDSVPGLADELHGMLDYLTAGTFGDRLEFEDDAWWHVGWYRGSAGTGGSRSRLTADRFAELRGLIPDAGLDFAPWPVG
ncbi:hypothetical protein D5S17_25335 [Pseudonocardiaceae bacterium YIM PH 21723]|nr:hypothetical protein D5S17_25335 [Pseudonocardiaceae bacterium YIM PH 21723]